MKSITLISYGTKWAPFSEAPVSFSCHGLPNPYLDPKLKELDGLDYRVSNYVLSDAQLTTKLVMRVLLHIRQNVDLTDDIRIGFACVGGRHRSVAVVKHLALALSELYPYITIYTIHRDRLKEYENPW